MLHVTNGDCAVEVLRAAEMQGDILPWRDVLHEGPLDPSLSLHDFSSLRISFIAGQGWAERGQVEKHFRERNARLERAASDEEVVLWFEHDLYDQLQLLQLLAWFHANPHPRLSLVCEAEYLGEMPPQRAAQLFPARRPVPQSQLLLGSRVWQAMGDVKSVLGEDLSELPFLKATLQRFLEEKPGPDGLSRTERQALEALRGGPLPFDELFRRTQEREEARFLGDAVFLKRLENLERLGRVRRDGARWKRL
jgi:hypothetical protein